MRVALLSAGPSLSSTYPGIRAQHDLLIGVNRAVELYDCHWWSCGDWQGVEMIRPIGRPRLFTMAPSADNLEARSTPAADYDGPIVRWDDVGDPLFPPHGWSTYSGPAALVLAVFLKAQDVDAYGVDLDGIGDCKGNAGEGGRDAQRWIDERSTWVALTKWARDRHRVRVYRHLPAVIHK